MAIYHLSTKPISRSSGRSAVASIAYRAGIKITDERLGKTYDYTKRSGVLWTGLATPKGFDIDRNELWNLAEKTETRSNSRTAREIVINIPHELMQGDQSAGKMLAYEFATNLSQKYQIAVDIAVHAPDKQGDNRNYHAHLLLTTRQIEQSKDGIFKLGKKSQLEMSNAQLKQAGLLSNQDELKEIRKEWAQLANKYLAEQGINARIDHRSHADRGLKTLPTVKMGWQATELERQGIRTDVGDQNRAIKAYNSVIEHQQDREAPVPAQQPKLPQNQQIALNASKTPVEPRKNESATLVPPTPKKSHQSENRASDEHQNIIGKVDFENPLLSPEQYRQILVFLQEFNERLEKIAKNILKNQLKALQIKAKPILANFEKLRDNKPLFFGKEQWEQDKQQALDAYNAVKQQHDTIKAKGVTTEHTKQASKQLAKDDPSYHQKGQQAFLQIKLHDQAELDNLAKQHGADKHAKSGISYSGKIIQSDDKISLQETKDGIVLHRIGGLEVGKGYTLNLDQDGKIYSIQQDHEIRTRTQQQKHDELDQDKGR